MAEKGKDFPLSITIRTIDKATSEIKRINERLDRAFEPFRKLRKEFGKLHENLGLDRMAAGVRGIGGMFKQLAGHALVLGGAAGVAALAFKRIVEAGDNLGDTAERVGLTVDALAQLRFAAQRSGSSAEVLDSGMQAFNRSLGQVRANTGRLAGFLKRVSPALLRQVKAAKSNEEAFGLMADAMAKVKDPAKRAALAAAAFGGAGGELAPLLAKGSAGIDELRKRYAQLAGPQQAAADRAGELQDSFDDLGAATEGVKASLLAGLGPAFLALTQRANAFFSANRGQIGEWLREFGEKLPARLEAVGEVLRGLFEVMRSVVRALGSMVEMVGGAENAVKLLVGAFVALKAVQLGTHLAGIARGFIGIVKAAGAARAAVVAATGAGAASAGAAGAAGAAGGAGVLGGVGRAALAGGAAVGGAAVAAVAGAVTLGIAGGMQSRRNQEEREAAAEQRGGSMMEALRHFRERQDAVSRLRLFQSLHQGGFVDSKTGRFAETPETQQALTGGRLNVGGDFQQVARQLEMTKTVAELNKVLAETRPTILGPSAPLAQQPTKTEITVSFENAPRGTRVTTAPGGTADVDLSLGFQMFPMFMP